MFVVLDRVYLLIRGSSEEEYWEDKDQDGISEADKASRMIHGAAIEDQGIRDYGPIIERFAKIYMKYGPEECFREIEASAVELAKHDKKIARGMLDSLRADIDEISIKSEEFRRSCWLPYDLERRHRHYHRKTEMI